jgi:hypothetical protein
MLKVTNMVTLSTISFSIIDDLHYMRQRLEQPRMTTEKNIWTYERGWGKVRSFTSTRLCTKHYYSNKVNEDEMGQDPRMTEVPTKV